MADCNSGSARAIACTIWRLAKIALSFGICLRQAAETNGRATCAPQTQKVREPETASPTPETGALPGINPRLAVAASLSRGVRRHGDRAPWLKRECRMSILLNRHPAFSR